MFQLFKGSVKAATQEPLNGISALMALEETWVPLAEGSAVRGPTRGSGRGRCSFTPSFLLHLSQSLQSPDILERLDLSAYFSNVLIFNCRGTREVCLKGYLSPGHFLLLFSPELLGKMLLMVKEKKTCLWRNNHNTQPRQGVVKIPAVAVGKEHSCISERPSLPQGRPATAPASALPLTTHPNNSS